MLIRPVTVRPFRDNLIILLILLSSLPAFMVSTTSTRRCCRATWALGGDSEAPVATEQVTTCEATGLLLMMSTYST